MLWKNPDFDRASNFNWINLYPPPEWDKTVKAYDFAVLTCDEMLKRITRGDNLRALSCKSILEERCFECR